MDQGDGVRTTGVPACDVDVEDGRWLYMSSDQHIGSASTDYRLLQREIEIAARLNALCLINGDLFDLILPSDRKRYEPSGLHERVRNRDDAVGEAIRWALELYEPVARNILVVGEGNHEHAVLKHHSVDPVRLFCDGIRAMGGEPRIAGPMGYVGFMVRGERKTAELQLFHFHGSGGQSRVTKGQIDIERQMASVRADAIVLGHKHWRSKSDLSVLRKVGRNVLQVRVLALQCGSYQLYDGYAKRFGMAPQWPGGWFARLQFVRLATRGVDATVPQLVGECGAEAF